MRPLVKWGALVTIVSIAPLTFVAAIYLHAPPNKLNEAIAIGFHPITPPMLLRAPGSIYHVSSDGQDYDMLCEVSPDRLVGVTVFHLQLPKSPPNYERHNMRLTRKLCIRFSHVPMQNWQNL